MILSDNEILKAIDEGRIFIDPYDSDLVGPCSVDLRLDSVFRVYDSGPTVDFRSKGALDQSTRIVDTGGAPFEIRPGQFILGQTIENLSVSSDLAGILEGKSSVARLGIIVHAAGLVNPGTGTVKPGKLTLEVYCMNVNPVFLYPGMQIVQIMFMPLTGPARVSYDKRESSRYVGQQEPDIR
ncbi:MAG: dCTP deaminase [Candidatus Thorarchaeota archaeon]|nr:MAG: dCTP deaminase [Candidatus Thorarchaeota archaeon]